MGEEQVVLLATVHQEENIGEAYVTLLTMIEALGTEPRRARLPSRR